MIHHDEKADAFIDASLAALYEESLQEIDLAARQVAQIQVDHLRARGSMFSETEVFENQYNGFIYRLGELAAQRSIE